MNNVNFEIELYEPMRKWLQEYLESKYSSAKITAIDAHARTLDSFLQENGILNYYPQTVGLDIQIDVLGIIKQNNNVKLVFIEAKKTPLNLHDLGQLWAYCKLCDPSEAFLLSSVGLGSLNKIINNLQRSDLLDFGNGNQIKKMRVGKWDVGTNSIDYKTLIPKF